MYLERVLSAKEATFVNRAQQKIMDLGVSLSEEASRGDITQEDYELALELQYAIDTLYSTFLDWDDSDNGEIEAMIDFYTLRATLAVIAYKALVFAPGVPVNGVTYATLAQLQLVDAAAIARDIASELALQAEIDRVEAESIARDAALELLVTAPLFSQDVTSAIKIGGIDDGDVFAQDSLIEDAIIKLLSDPNDVSVFSFDTYSSLIEVGQSVTITTFTWTVSGVPISLLLNDDVPILVNQAVTGALYTPGAPIVYPFATPKSIVWTLSGDNVTDQTKTIKSIYRSYYGKKAVANDDALITVTESDILAGTSQLSETDVNVTVTADTTNGEMGWIAVPKTQTAGDYTFWEVDTMNAASIGVGEFISAPVDVSVNGVTYSVYRWSYRSPLTQPITLKR